MKASSRFAAVIQQIDRIQGADPRRIQSGGIERGYESLYAERMSRALAGLHPEASELLRLAARAQHLRRWDIPRERYPGGRLGYESWRRACREHHVAVLSPILQSEHYEPNEIAHVAKLIRKENLKTDAESQALEDAVAIVFIEHYIGEFLEKYSALPDAKLIGILKKTLQKMSAKGREAARMLPLSAELRALLEKATAPQ